MNHRINIECRMVDVMTGEVIYQSEILHTINSDPQKIQNVFDSFIRGIDSGKLIQLQLECQNTYTQLEFIEQEIWKDVHTH